MVITLKNLKVYVRFVYIPFDLGLENARKNYREQKRIFDEAIAYDKGENSSQIDPDDIDFLIDDLFKLELNGKTLKSIVNN